MSEQSTPENVLHHTLYVLVRRLGLSPAEVARLRLSDLHLAGKNPNISFTPVGREVPKTVELDLETHRALVGWLVSRPDSISDLLFLGDKAEPLEPEEIQWMVEEIEKRKPAGQKTETHPDRPTFPPEAGPTPPNEASRVSASRPVPPLSRPERGAPPPGLSEARAFSFKPPPPAAPEVDEAVNISLPSAMPKPPPAQPPEAELDSARPARPVDKKLKTPSRGGPTRQAEAQPESPAPEQDRPTGRPAASQDRPVAQAPLETERQVERSSSKQASLTDERPPRPAKPADHSPATEAPSAAASTPLEQPPAKAGARRMVKRKRKPTAEQAAQQPRPTGTGLATLTRLIIPVGVAVAVLICAVCAGAGWFAWQSETVNRLVAGLGQPDEFSDEEARATLEAVAFESPLSPLATPTLPPTETATAPPIDTPSPSETPTPLSTDTPLPLPTDTPIPTDTPVPTDTPTPSAPADTPTPTLTPTPAMKYAAPVLLEPDDDFKFIAGNTIVLRWQSVGELAPTEQYAVRLVYRYNNETTYQGANVKETEWTVPLSLYGQIDPPENRYEWFVVVERLNEDGSGTAISPESERRGFTWR